MVGCKVKQKVVTEYVAVHDTLVTHHVDTISDIRVVTHTDTIKQVEWHTLTLGQSGDTIKEVHIYHDREKTIVVDSTNRYKATVDSLRAALVREANKVKEVTKTKHVVRWWEWLVIVGIVGMLVYGAKLMKA
jgi:hypothetical protein